ncbi:forkhead box protein P3 [Ascaphus truei]|uniref:forkhead box protein P3 n=1 Tax=Ascaphus truei TaxID=8439 RepID=UPI003F590B36
MPSHQNTKSVPAPSGESESRPHGKGKEQSSFWNRRGAEHQHPYIMVTPPDRLSSSPHLRALLQDHTQAVVIHPLSRDSASHSPVIRLSPAASSSLLNLHPARLFPAKHRPLHPVAQGLNLASLEWVQQESPYGKTEEVILGKKPHTTPALDTEKSPKKSPSAGQDKDSAELACPVFSGGACTFPGCEKAFADDHQFLRHLYNDHHRNDKGAVQWLIQTEVVQNLEQQLAVEKQKLQIMQSQTGGKIQTPPHLCRQRERGLILHPAPLSVPAWSGLSVPLPKEFSDTVLAVRRQLWESSSINIFQNMTNCTEYYKTNKVRPPFTYASLIRWAIMESPQKQLALNEIYHWFTTMFAYFRFNTATWKNAVRHNLSLHKCFVRVENIKGAVWVVDELEFQRRRGARSCR